MPPSPGNGAEARRVRSAYARRSGDGRGSRYRSLAPGVLQVRQERERATLRLLKELEPALGPVEGLTLLEVGCGTGANLLDCLRWGFRPENLAGNELLEDRLAEARWRLPEALRLFGGDAARPADWGGPYDIVLQAMVLTSVLDPDTRRRLAERMWAHTKPGGGVLWYDFHVDNPRNPDVRGVPVGEVRALFPGGRVYPRRITLAPPLGRRLARIHPGLYALANAFPWLRTHTLAWIQKPAE